MQHWCLCTICVNLLSGLAMPHLHSQVFIYLFHSRLYLIGMHLTLNLALFWAYCKHHLGIDALNYKRWCALCSFRWFYIQHELGQGKPYHPFDMVLVSNHRQILQYTGIHSFCPSSSLRVTCADKFCSIPKQLHNCHQTMEANSCPLRQTIGAGCPSRRNKIPYEQLSQLSGIDHGSTWYEVFHC